MVLQRTIDNLRERPHHERRAVALGIAVSVMLILFLCWGIYFFRTIGSPDLKPLQEAYINATQQASAANAVQENVGWVSAAPENAQVYTQEAQTEAPAPGDSGKMQLIEEKGTASDSAVPSIDGSSGTFFQ